MRSYTIDELSPEETRHIAERLSEMNLSSSIEGMFWCPIPQDMLTPTQKEHQDACGPYSMALIVEDTSLHLEMLVRARGKIHCHCIAYASPELRAHMIGYFDDLVESLGITA